MSIQTNFPALKPTLLLDFSNVEQLDPRITFTRASTATYYGMQTAMAEQNLLTRSQELGVGAWSSTNATVTANSTAAPDGTTTADTLIDDATSGAHVCAQVVTLVASSIYTQSFFLKANTNNFAIVTLSSTTTNNYISAVVNLSTGAITQTGTGTSATFTSSSITSVGNGWYRVVITGSTTSGFTRAEVGLAPAATGNTFATNGRIVYVGTGTSIFVWGAQLEQRSAATAYTATVTEPITTYIPRLLTAASGVARFDHNPTTFESLGLLIEESRTNLLTYSEQFNDAAWTTKANGSVTTNTAIAPDGILTADAYIDNSTNGAHYIGRNITLTTVAYTFSVYVKAAGINWIGLEIYDVSARLSYFNLATGVTGTNASGNTSTITAVGNGWYRCTVTRTMSSTGSAISVYLATADGVINYTGNGYSGIYIWGAQLEAGAFATSYIPTVASQVTRAADAASMTGTNFSSWYRTDEWTLYGEAENRNGISANTNYHLALLISDAVNTTAQILRIDGATNRVGTFGSNGTIANQWNFTTGSVIAKGAFAKATVAYKLNDVAASSNGETVTTDTSAQIPSLNTLQIGIGVGGQMINGSIKKLAYYPLRVTNAQLQALTG